MKKPRPLFRTALGICLITSSAANLWCGPFSYSGYRIEDLFAKSDVVVLGSVEKTQVLRERSIRGPVGMQSMSAVVRVEKKYQGNCENDILVQFEVQVPVPTGASGLSLYKGDRALLFLKANEDGTYRFADAPWGKLNAEGISLGADTSGVDALELDLNQSLKMGNVGQSNALRLLQAFSRISSSTESTLNRLTKQPDANVAAEAFSILIATGNPNYFESVLPFLRGNVNSIKGDELWILGGRIHEFGLKADPQIIAAISNVPIFSIQYVALDVLGQIKSPATAEVVLHHLDDPDPNLQYKSLSVFSKIVDRGEARGPEYSPSKPDFDKDPAYYTGLWKVWWEKQGKANFSPGNLDDQ